jgi:dihydrolipoyl dehydrogenase
LQYAVRGLVAQAVSVTESGGGSENIGRTSHSHPALSEAMRQAALNVEERALHIINR